MKNIKRVYCRGPILYTENVKTANVNINLIEPRTVFGWKKIKNFLN